jgi:hypothetical protein
MNYAGPLPFATLLFTPISLYLTPLRFVSPAGCKRKFDIPKYAARVLAAGKKLK